jgi:molecular chaperone DnaK
MTGIRAATDDLERTMQRVGQEIYSQPGANGSYDGAGGSSSTNESGTVEGEFREV